MYGTYNLWCFIMQHINHTSHINNHLFLLLIIFTILHDWSLWKQNIFFLLFLINETRLLNFWLKAYYLYVSFILIIFFSPDKSQQPSTSHQADKEQSEQQEQEGESWLWRNYRSRYDVTTYTARSASKIFWGVFLFELWIN